MGVLVICVLVCRPVFTHGPPGSGPREANFQGRHIKKIEIEVWYAEKKGLSTTEKFKGDILKTRLVASFLVTMLLALEGAEAIAY